MDQTVSQDVPVKDAPLSNGIKFKVAKHGARAVERQLPAPLNKEDVLKSVWSPSAVNSSLGTSTSTTCKGECVFQF